MEGYRLGVWQEQAGEAYDILLSYFVFRCLITSWEDLWSLLPRLALFIVPMTLCMVWERHTGRSVLWPWAVLMTTGIETGLFVARELFGRPNRRTFQRHLNSAFCGLYFINAQRRKVAVAGIIAATIITYTSKLQWTPDGLLSSLVGLASGRAQETCGKCGGELWAFLFS